MANTSNASGRLQNALALMVAALMVLFVITIVMIPIVTVFFPNPALSNFLVAFAWLTLPAAALLIILVILIQIRSKGKAGD